MRSIRVNDAFKAYAKPPMRLGEVVIDDAGDEYVVVKGSADLVFGAVLRQTVEIKTGTVTTAAAIGTNQLVDSAEFAANTTEDVAGAWGQTLGTLANGGGQAFTVNSKLSDNALVVTVRYYTVSAGVARSVPDGKWAVALNTSSTYDITMPGRVAVATLGKPVKGVCLVDGGVDVSEAPYFYAKRTGIAPVLVDDSDSNILPGEWVTVSTSTEGWVEGINATVTPTATEIASLVGVALAGDVGADCLLLVDLAFMGPVGKSYRVTRREHPYNAVNVA